VGGGRDRTAGQQQARDGRPHDDVQGRSGGTLLEVKWLAAHVTPRLRQVTQPCLVFHPRYDDRSALSASQDLQKALGGVVDLIVLDDSYHLVTLDRQRDLVLERVLEFAGALPRLISPANPEEVD
jgi:carboxylesterase